MSLASPFFLLFVFIVLLLWRHVFTGETQRRYLLLAASYLFYCAWDARLLTVLAMTTVVQWSIGSRIQAARSSTSKKVWLTLSVAYGLVVLGYFKYSNFFAEELLNLLSWMDLDSLRPFAGVAAPIGISFYTFQSLTYTVDIYRGRGIPARSLRDFALFMAFFPHVTSGPIARSHRLLPQLEGPSYRGPLEAEAVYLILRGLFKKIAIADVLATQFVQPAFASPGQWSSWFLLLSVIAYSFQIYMDLSGYTDLARGAARCFGYRLDINFNRPYLAKTVSEFWQRWHMSMSGFFRDYLYHALGGSRAGNVYVNLLLTFIAIGLWHGAGWNFIVYGLLHGSVVAAERYWRERRKRLGLPTSPARPVTIARGLLTTFAFVAMARILFVAEDLSGAGSFLREMFSSAGSAGAAGPQGYGTLLIAVLLHFTPQGLQTTIANRAFRLPAPIQALGLIAFVYSLVILAGEARPFVYFNF